jgi:endonuclease YncB( thermonuclease family)
MNRDSTFRFLAVLSLLLGLAAGVSAATLQAKVVEVRTGNIIVVSNINRAVSVRLKAVVPPEAGQPFNDVARDHLKALVLEKTVTVEYTHFADNYLEARVLLNGIDIGSQMLRDGVVWYDHALDYELSQPDRDLYSQCEAAARAEKRGLWQDPKPLAPWEYRRLQDQRLAQITNPTGSQTSPAQLRKRSAGLSNDDVMKVVMGSSSPTYGMPDVKPISNNGDADRWVKYNSAAGHFSVTLPSNAVEGADTITDPLSGAPVALNFVTGGNNLGFYFAVAAKGPNGKYTDESMREEFLRGLISGMNAAARADGHPTVDVKADRAISLNGYNGMQYRVTGEGVTGGARVFTKQVGNDRLLYVVMSFNRPGGEDLGDQFLRSFAITR